ncbi:MAG TPA: hypothetical protein VGN34_29715, partial [Ktedonobacteraceae bacterium]
MSLRTFLSHWQSGTWRTQRVRTGGGRLHRYLIFAAATFVAFACTVASGGGATALAASSASSASSGVTVLPTPSMSSGQPNFGQNVYIFNPSMPQSEIQSTVDAVASQQVSNQFGTQRYALLFEPGTYGSSTTPLNFQVESRGTGSIGTGLEQQRIALSSKLVGDLLARHRVDRRLD